MDKATTEELLNFMLESIVMIEKRFSSIKTIDDFLSNDTGVQKLDSIAMRIQAIGEALKNLYKREIFHPKSQDNFQFSLIPSLSHLP